MVQRPGSLSIAFCCHRARGTYLHIWWDCNLLQPFWTMIFQVYNEIYDESLTPSPTIALLSILPGSVKSQKVRLFQIFFFSFSCKATYFHILEIHIHAPLLSLWVDIVSDTMLMEEMQARKLKKWDKFTTLWYIWMHYYASELLRLAHQTIFFFSFLFLLAWTPSLDLIPFTIAIIHIPALANTALCHLGRLSSSLQ